jgi:hypothetical protein
MVKIRYLDGRRFRRAVLAGIKWLQSKREHLNAINVYPVPDADTGTNMSLTMASAAEGLRNSKDRSIHTATRGLAERAIMGSQGNSGAILAQFFQGLSDGLHGKFRITTQDFASAVERGKQAAYSALSQPREGTILTVIKDWCNAIAERKDVSDDFAVLLREALTEARASVLRTPDQLAILKEHGVVDAGAQGFVNLLEGITEYVETGSVRTLNFEAILEPEPFVFAHAPVDIHHRFCTECMVEASGVSRAAVEAVLAPLGESIVIVSGERVLKVHIHTDEPDAVFEAMEAFGPLVKRKRQDMQVQHEEAVADTASAAIVADTACDLPEAYLLENRIAVVPLRVNFGDQVFLDRVEISPEEFMRKCQMSPIHPKTSQPAVGDYLKVFGEASAGGKDVIVVCLAGGLSGTLNAAKTAASQFKGALVHVVDSCSLSVGQGLLVQQARELARDGMKPALIAARLDEIKRQLAFFVSLRSLEFARRGGRVSLAASAVSRILNLKPVLGFDPEGKAYRAAVAFGSRGVEAKVLDLARKEWSRYTKFRVAVAHAAAPAVARGYRDRIRELTGLSEVPVMEVSAVLAAHAGPGAAGIAVLGLD